jgi:hypothetical protein
MAAGGCATHRVELQPIKVEPIHLTLDVNVKVDRELDRFFEYERQPVEIVPVPVPVPVPDPDAGVPE